MSHGVGAEESGRGTTTPRPRRTTATIILLILLRVTTVASLLLTSSSSSSSSAERSTRSSVAAAPRRASIMTTPAAYALPPPPHRRRGGVRRAEIAGRLSGVANAVAVDDVAVGWSDVVGGSGVELGDGDDDGDDEGSDGGSSERRRRSFVVRFSRRHPSLARSVGRPGADVRPAAEWIGDYLGLASDGTEANRVRKFVVGDGDSGWIDRLIFRRRLRGRMSLFLLPSVAGLSRSQLRRLFVSRPQLLSYRRSNLLRTSRFFRVEMGLSASEYANALKVYPGAMMHSVDGRLRPTSRFLTDEVGGGRDNWTGWRRVLTTHPQIFAYSLEGTLRPRAAFFRGGDGEDDGSDDDGAAETTVTSTTTPSSSSGLGLNRSELSQVAARFPPALWTSESALASKMDFLRESLGLTRPELRALVVGYPQVLGLSVDRNLRGKVAFFLAKPLPSSRDGAGGGCGLTREQLKEFVLYQPALLAYSFEKRLKPRVAKMREENISFAYSPRAIMSYTDARFDDWMTTQSTTWSAVSE